MDCVVLDHCHHSQVWMSEQTCVWEKQRWKLDLTVPSSLESSCWEATYDQDIAIWSKGQARKTASFRTRNNTSLLAPLPPSEYRPAEGNEMGERKVYQMCAGVLCDAVNRTSKSVFAHFSVTFFSVLFGCIWQAWTGDKLSFFKVGCGPKPKFSSAWKWGTQSKVLSHELCPPLHFQDFNENPQTPIRRLWCWRIWTREKCGWDVDCSTNRNPKSWNKRYTQGANIASWFIKD